MDNIKISNFKELANLCANRNPDGVAFKWIEGKDIKEITNSSFRQNIDELGTYCYYNGLKNSHIAVIGENSYEWILTYFATVIGNNVIVPVDRDLPCDSIINVLKFEYYVYGGCLTKKVR